MDRAFAQRLETLADGFSSVSLGGAVGLCVYLLAPMALQPALVACASAAAVVAYGASRWLLSRVARKVPRAKEADVAARDALWGDNLIAAADPQADARPAGSSVVVQLFEQADAAATARPVASADWPASASPAGAACDASASLHEALNQLRQSLANRP
jgi:hypothetical protein